jgi:hypothetical protein
MPSNKEMPDPASPLSYQETVAEFVKAIVEIKERLNLPHRTAAIALTTILAGLITYPDQTDDLKRITKRLKADCALAKDMYKYGPNLKPETPVVLWACGVNWATGNDAAEIIEVPDKPGDPSPSRSSLLTRLVMILDGVSHQKGRVSLARRA